MFHKVRSTKARLWGHAAVAALGIGGLSVGLVHGAAAQEAPVKSGAAALEEVVVTATRRAEKLNRVPIAVTAIGAEQLKQNHIVNFADIPLMVPGPSFVPTKGPSESMLVIRGQQTTNDAPALEVPVAVFIDDIYYGSLGDYDSDFYDASQIAVLRGPQGTTFGRNVVGGAVQVTNNKPELGTNDAEIRLTGAAFRNDNLGFDTTGYVNQAISDDAAARVAFSFKDDPGYQHNLVTGNYLDNRNSGSGRAQLRYVPTSNLDMNLSVEYSDISGFGDGSRAYGQGAMAAAQMAASPDLHNVFLNDDGQTKRQIFASNFHVDWTTDLGTVTSVTGYRTLNSYYREDADASPLVLQNPYVNINKESQFSQEVRLASKSGGTLDYVFGVYYSYEWLYKSILFTFDGTNPASLLHSYTGGTVQQQTVSQSDHTTSAAPYGEVTWHIIPEISLTAGVRYSYESKNGYTNHDAGSVFYPGVYFVPWSHSWEALTPRFILDYKPNDDLMFYASASSGFKGGGWSMTPTNAAAAAVPLQPEKSWSYELGSKTMFFDRHLSVNIAAFLANTQQVQVRSLVGPILFDTNAGSLRAEGVEAEIVASPVDGLELGLNYANTNAYYKKFPGCAAGGFSCTGNEVPYQPLNDLTLFGTYTYDMGNRGNLTFHVDDKFTSTYALTPAGTATSIGRPLTKQDGVMNMWLSYAPESDKWDIQFWAKNLTDKTYATQVLNYYFYLLSPAEYGAGNREADNVKLAPPRQIGVTVSYRF